MPDTQLTPLADNTVSQDKQPFKKQYQELNVTAAFFGGISTFLVACLQLASKDAVGLEYFIPVAPAVSALLTYFIIRKLRKMSYTDARLSVLSDVEEKYKRIYKKLEKQIKELENDYSKANGTQQKEFIAKQIELVREEKAKTFTEEREEIKSVKIPSLDLSYIREDDSTWLKNSI